jgi:hypothetical protein
MDYVSPIDERAVLERPLAPRRAGLAGRSVALLDIGKSQGDRFLDRLEALLREQGATVARVAKPFFSRPAPADVLERAAVHDLAVIALAD